MKNLFFITVIAVLFTLGCGSSDNQSDDNTEQDSVAAESSVNSDEVLAFITKPEYGWKQADKEYFLAFLTDGRASIQGDQGEATMWEGTWVLDGSTLKVTSDEFGEQIYTVKIDGAELLLNDTKFVAYQP